MESAVLQIKMQTVEKATLPWVHPYGMLQDRQIHRFYWKKNTNLPQKVNNLSGKAYTSSKDIRWGPAIQTTMLL